MGIKADYNIKDKQVKFSTNDNGISFEVIKDGQTDLIFSFFHVFNKGDEETVYKLSNNDNGLESIADDFANDLCINEIEDIERYLMKLDKREICSFFMGLIRGVREFEDEK